MTETDRAKQPINHPTQPELQAFVSGRLSIQETDRIAQHLASCDSCCQHLQDTKDDRLIALARTVRRDSVAETVIDSESKNPEYANTRIMSASSGGRQSKALPSEAAGDDTETPEELQQHPRYEVLSVLGKGGMGVVYRARHRIMERQVALKVINSRFTSNQIAVERFQQEVRAAARLSHPNIVTAYDAEEAGLLHFLVMEFIEGQSLAQIVAERGPLPISEATELIRQACRGLQHAHDQKMIHRDIKPQNLMVTSTGQLKILDFGLARLAICSENVSQTAATAMNLTAVGMLLGTPDFMSPEQAIDATSVDARSDIYSLGCTLFYLLSATSPFCAGSFSEMLQAGLHRSATSLTAFRSDLPPSLIRILERMMADAPEMRFQSAVQVAEALDALGQPELSAKTSIPESTAPESATSPQKSQSALTAAPVQTERIEQQPARHRRQRSTPKRSGRTDRREGTGTAPASRNRTTLTSHIKAALVRHRILWACAMALMTAAVIIPAVWPTGDRPLNQDLTVGPTIQTAPGEDRSQTSAVARQQSTVPQRQPQPQETAAKQNAGRKSVADLHTIPRILMLIPNKEFNWADRTAFDALADQGIIELTTTSWSTTVEGTSPSEPPMPVDLLLKDVVPGDYDAILINGGRQLIELTTPGALHEEAGRIIRQMWSDGKLVVGISAGSGVLASLDLLDTVKATGHPLIHEDVRTRFGVTLSSTPVIRSGQFITARDNAAIPELLRELRAALNVSGNQANP